MENNNNSKFEFFNKVLSDIEKEHIRLFVESDAFEVIRKILLDKIYYQGVPVDAGQKPRNFVFGIDPANKLSDEEYGRNIRTHIDAIFEIEKTFEQLRLFAKAQPTEKPTQNRAR